MIVTALGARIGFPWLPGLVRLGERENGAFGFSPVSDELTALGDSHLESRLTVRAVFFFLMNLVAGIGR